MPVSALAAFADQPRAVIVALHGGGVTGRYFDLPAHPELSLLRIGAALGFTVVALDRPGYGASAAAAADFDQPADRVAHAYDAVDAVLAGSDRGAGTFLLAHSLGSELALRMALDPRGAGLLGLELGGTGRHHNPDAVARMTTGHDVRPDRGLIALLWQPTELYPADVLGARGFAHRAPAYEALVVRGWGPRDLAALAPQVRVPVRYSLGDHETVWTPGVEGLRDVSGLFTGSPRVVTHEQRAAGHSLSVSRTAAAYHLSVLAFVEECLADRDTDVRLAGEA